MEKVILFLPVEKAMYMLCVSPVILQHGRGFVSTFLIAHCLLGTRTGASPMEASVSANKQCLLPRVPSPRIPSWTRRVEDGGSPLQTLTSCLGIQLKPTFCPQKWDRRHHLMVRVWVFVLFPRLLFFPSPPSLFGTVGWIWQTLRVIWGKHKPQWNSKYETFIHRSEAKPCWVIALPGIRAQRVRSCSSFNFQSLAFNFGVALLCAPTDSSSARPCPDCVLRKSDALKYFPYFKICYCFCLSECDIVGVVV